VSKLIIRKRVNLDFLGDEYKEAYLVFKSIPVSNYDKILDDIRGVGEENTKAKSVMLNILKEYYIEGQFPNEKGVLEKLDGKDELDGLDKDALMECFGKITGQDIKGAIENPEEGIIVDPKSDTPSKRGSTVENQPQ
jgi:hypothetical protein